MSNCVGCGNDAENHYAVVGGYIHLCDRCRDIIVETEAPK